MPGGEQHERHRDDVGEAALDEAIDGEVGQRLGHLDEAEVDRQLPGDLANRPRQRPELLDAVGVAAAVADDEQGRRSVGSHVLVRRDRVQVGHENPRTATVAATAIAGSASAAAQASGRAGASRPVAGMRPS